MRHDFLDAVTKDLFEHLTTVLNELGDTGIFTLLLDTTSEITDLIDPEQELKFFDDRLLKVNPPIYCFNTYVLVNYQAVSTREVTRTRVCEWVVPCGMDVAKASTLINWPNASWLDPELRGG